PRAPPPSRYTLRHPLSPCEIDVGAGVLARAPLPSRYSLRHPLSPTEIDVGAGVLARAQLPSRCSLTVPLSHFSGPLAPSRICSELFLPHRSQHRVLNLLRFGSHPQMPQHHRRRQNRSKRISHVLTRNPRSRAVHRLEHRRFARMNIPARRHAQPTLQSRGKIGNDVAEHVVGHDDVKLPWIPHHLQAKRIHIHVFCANPRIFARHFIRLALPPTADIGPAD